MIDERIPDQFYIDFGLAGIQWRSIQTYSSWFMLISPRYQNMDSFFDTVDKIKEAGYTVLSASFDASGLLGGNQFQFTHEDIWKKNEI